MNIGEQLKQKRLSMKLSLAKATGLLEQYGLSICQSTLFKYESGKLPNDNNQTLSIIMKAYGMLDDSIDLKPQQPKVKHCDGCIHYCYVDRTCNYMYDTGHKRGMTKEECYKHPNTPYKEGNRSGTNIVRNTGIMPFFNAYTYNKYLDSLNASYEEYKQAAEY